MKKFSILMLCALLLTGCSSTFSTKVTDSSKVIVSNDKVSISKQDFYEYLLDTYGPSQVLNLVLSEIANKEVTDETAINDLLKERVDLYDTYSDGGIEQYVEDMGYASLDEYKELVLLPDVKQELLREKYIEENFDTLMSDYNVCSIKTITVEKESSALSLIEQVTDEKAFDELMDTYGEESTEDLGIVTKNTTIDDGLTAKLADFAKVEADGVFSEAVKLSDDTYAVVYIYNTDVEENKDDYLSTLTADADIITAVEGYYLDKYEFTVNEEKTKEAIKNLSEDYID